MLVAQGYKKPNEFTLPAEGADIVRRLIAARLVTVAAAMDDPNAPKCFKPRELTAIAFERLMLAKMLSRMPEAEVKMRDALQNFAACIAGSLLIAAPFALWLMGYPR